MAVEEEPQMEEALQVEVVGEGIQVKVEEEEGVEAVELACQLMKMGEEVQLAGSVQHVE